MPEIDWDTVPRPQLTAAVRAVLEMHRTIEIPGSPGAYWCQHCQLQDDVSCPTVHALTAALSVTP